MNFSSGENDGVLSLYAEARFPKRELDACMRLVELYEMGRLCVSIELRYNPEHSFRKDGVLFVDAHEDNALTGIAIVSDPANRSAVALDMVAEAADNSEIVTDGEEPAERGETDLDEKEKTLTAEAETKEVVETAVAEEVEPVVAETIIAEGEDGAEDEESGEGTNDGESEDGAVVDPSEEEPRRVNAEVEQTQAEVLEHSVDTHESVENYCGEPVHVIEFRERVIETMEEAGTVIAELEHQIAELNEIKEKYDAIIAEREAAVLAEKQEKARVFAEKQGLDVKETAVAEAIQALDYAAIAELTMAQVKEEDPEPEAEPVQKISLASFVDLDVSDNNKYGGLLKPRNK